MSDKYSDKWKLENLMEAAMYLEISSQYEIMSEELIENECLEESELKDIAHKMVYKNPGLWEQINDAIWEQLDEALNESTAK